MTNLRCAVVGVGYLGRFHAQKYNQLSSATLVGVSDASFERAQEVATELEVRAFESPKQLIGEVDAVTVAATTTAHYELVKLFLEAGIHVNVEKPMTENVDQALSLVRLAESKGLVLSVGHIERFNPVFMELQKRVKCPVLIECTRHAPFRLRGSEVSVAHDLMIHDIDLVLTLARSPIRSITAKGTTIAGGSWDAINASIQFESGVLAQISASRVAASMKREIRIIEEGSIFRGDFMAAQIEHSSKGSSSDEPVLHNIISVEKHDALFEETRDFVESVSSKRRPKVSADDGVSALEVVEKVIDAL